MIESKRTARREWRLELELELQLGWQFGLPLASRSIPIDWTADELVCGPSETPSEASKVIPSQFRSPSRRRTLVLGRRDASIASDSQALQSVSIEWPMKSSSMDRVHSPFSSPKVRSEQSANRAHDYRTPQAGRPLATSVRDELQLVAILGAGLATELATHLHSTAD